MTVTASVTVPASELVLARIFDGSNVRLELPPLLPFGDNHLPYVWVSGSYNDSAIEQRVRNELWVERLTPLGDVEDRRLYRIEWAADSIGFLTVLQEHDVLPQRAVYSDEEWTFRLQAIRHETVSKFLRDCLDQGIPVELQSVSCKRPSSGPEKYGLTHKQRSVVVFAVENGYFNDPHERTLTQLAEMYGTSRQAFSRCLCRGVRKVLLETVMSGE